MTESDPQRSRTIRFDISDLAPLIPKDGQALVVVQLMEDGVKGYARIEEHAPLTIGRAEDCSLRVLEAGISNHHARLSLVAGELRIKDLGSTNGTWVGAESIREECPLAIGTRFRLGRTGFEVRRTDLDELEREMERRRDLQRAGEYIRAIIPEPLETDHFDIDWTFEPASQIGGDVFGYEMLDADRLMVFLIDVSGHGAASALHSVSVANGLRRRTLKDVDFGEPRSVLEGLNRAFDMEAHGGNFFTIWYGVYDIRRRHLSFGSGGHPAAVLRRADGSTTLLQTRGPALGLYPTASFVSAEMAITAGDRLYVFSDGAFEIRLEGGGIWTQDALREEIGRSPAPSPADLLNSTLERSQTPLLDDDYTVLVAGFH